MIAVTAKLTVQPGKGDEFERLAADLAAKVNAHEPGCHLYELFKSNEGVYLFMEKYSDNAALTAHGQTDYFLAAQPGLGGCLSAPPVIEIYDAVVK